MRVWDVHKCPGAEDTKSGDIRLFPAPGFFWGDIPKGSGGYDIMEVGCVFERVMPVQLREVSIEEHCPDLVK